LSLPEVGTKGPEVALNELDLNLGEVIIGKQTRKRSILGLHKHFLGGGDFFVVWVMGFFEVHFSYTGTEVMIIFFNN